VGTHAGGYVSLISTGRFREAYLLARRPNPFASICGRICAHPCESACRRQHIDAPVSIRALKRFVTDRFGVESGASRDEILEAVERPRPKTDKGRRVAVVGAGPAGLSCAHDLALMGHHPVVFDAAPVGGGMMRLGIPEYRLPRQLIQDEIGFIQSLGVELRLGVEIGTETTFEALCSEYGAVFLAPGCRRGRSLKIPGMDRRGVLTAVDFLVSANLGQELELGKEIVVVGGGNVAFDVARTARRFGGTSVPDESHHNLLFDAAITVARAYGVKVTLVSLESRQEMPADFEEIHEGLREGITIIHRRGPAEVLGENGSVQALRTIDCSRVFDAEGRFAPEFVPGSEKEIPCDTVIFAVGQVADLSFLGKDHGLEVTPRSTIAVERETLATSRPGVYAGGDVAFGPRIVIEAVADGRRAARAMDSYLTGRTDPPARLALRSFDTFGYEHPFAAGDYERLGRGVIPTIELARRHSHAEVEAVYTEEQAKREGARCLHCWVNTIFDSRSMSGSECIQCGGCVDVCPEDCIDLVSLLRLAGNGNGAPLRLADGRPLALAGAPGAALIKDETSCIRCGLCARRCPVGCISMQGFYREDEMKILQHCETNL
jgi:NADPH-dependent glutamate synthase beta subunit-like oxidoreductase